MQARVRRIGWAGLFPGMVSLLLPLFGSGALAACGSERAVRVEIVAEQAGDRLCLVAHGAGDVRFAEGYPWATLPEGERTLTFVAGARVREVLSVTARIGREGEQIASATARVRFSDQGLVEQVLRPARCTLGATAASGARAGGTFAALASPPRAIAADVDGDGGDELCAIGADGSLQVLDAEDRDAGSRRTSELRAETAALVAAGDLDGDCRIDLVAADALGALIVIGADGASAPPVGASARDVAIGLAAGGAIAIAIAGDGLAWTPWDADAASSLAGGTFGAVEAGDLTGDGRGDLVAAGDAGVQAFVGTEGGPIAQPGVLPGSIAAMTGAVIALGDLDADGALDLAAASGTSLRIAINRGDGLLEDRTGAAPPLAIGAAAIVLGDLDGDCADEVVVRGSDGSISVLARDARGALAPIEPPAGAFADAVILDADGDGARELALLDAAGAVTLWRP